MHVNPEYTCHRLLPDIAFCLSEMVIYLVLKELTFIIISMTDSKLQTEHLV